MIQSHLYARNPETPVYRNPFAEDLPITFLHKGSWMGMLEQKGDWIYVITIEGAGWVLRECTEERLPGDLHILLSPDLTIEYVNTVHRFS